MASNNLTDIVAQRCRALFLESKRTLSDIAKSMGFTHSALVNWKNGVQMPSIRSLEFLSMEFNVPLEYFFTTDERAESILYGTPLRSDDAEVNKLRKELAEAWQTAEKRKAETDAVVSENERLQKQIELMQVELDHYRNEPPKADTSSEVVTTARQSVEVSRRVLDAVISLLDGIEVAS